jgi:hypothetical protein
MDWLTPDRVQAIAACISVIIAIVGLVFVIVQLRQVKRAIRGNTNEMLSSQSVEILRFFAERPAIYDHFYSNKGVGQKDIDEGDSQRRVDLLCATELMANYMEHICLQKDNLPPKAWLSWRKFVLDIYQNSPVVRDFLQAHTDWYASDILDLVGIKPKRAK